MSKGIQFCSNSYQNDKIKTSIFSYLYSIHDFVSWFVNINFETNQAYLPQEMSSQLILWCLPKVHFSRRTVWQCSWHHSTIEHLWEQNHSFCSNVHSHCIANQHGIYIEKRVRLDSSTHIYLLLEFESKVSVVLPLCTIIPWKLINGSMWSYGFVWPPCGMYF